MSRVQRLFPAHHSCQLDPPALNEVSHLLSLIVKTILPSSSAMHHHPVKATHPILVR